MPVRGDQRCVALAMDVCRWSMMCDRIRYFPQVQQEVTVEEVVIAIEMPAHTPEMDQGLAGQQSVNTPEDCEAPAGALEEVRGVGFLDCKTTQHTVLVR